MIVLLVDQHWKVFSDLVSQQGGIITKFVCVMELPDLDGRLRLGRCCRRTHSSGCGKDIDIFSMCNV